MSRDDAFYAEFVAELAALDSFLTTRAVSREEAAAGPARPGQRSRVLPVSRHDPDVRRLLEAMAYFSARTRMLAAGGLRDAVSRLHRGYFDFLLAPVPAMALLQAVPRQGLRAPAALPRGTEVRLTTPAGSVGLFSTTRPLTVLPLAVGDARVMRRGRSGFRLVIRLDAMTPMPAAALGLLSLHVDHLADYHRSREITQMLTSSLERASVFFDLAPSEEADGAWCDAYCGAPRVAALPDGDELEHPLARIRSFFHFPAQELFLNLHLPGSERPWRSAWVCVDLDENWPRDIVLNKDVFQLFVVPVTNLHSAPARPIRCDGTKEAYPLHGVHPVALGGVEERPGEEIRLHAVTGVYRLTARGQEPIRSGLLSDEGEVYEIEVTGDDPDELEHRLLLKMPGAFEAPKTVIAAARWYQPAFDAVATGRLDASLQKRSLSSVDLRLTGNLAPHRTSPLWNHPLKLLHLMSLRTKVDFSREELADLLRLLGADEASLHRGIADLVTDVTASEAPEGGPRGGVRYVYELTLRPYEPALQGLVDDLRDKLHALLDAWLPGAVEVRTASPSRAKLLPEGEAR
ncbi:type VI secretion system baseplate subunit TssF [Sorangium sp. So ce136]|uniref:type VI secretion system baseplate subunit TssF n=1 Tax=Sorangium sp. So ce136 TaxID=3133284 RepID=UPI003F02AC2C